MEFVIFNWLNVTILPSGYSLRVVPGHKNQFVELIKIKKFAPESNDLARFNSFDQLLVFCPPPGEPRKNNNSICLIINKSAVLIENLLNFNAYIGIIFFSTEKKI